jgi:hypothetical protein
MRELACLALDIGKDAVAALRLEAVEGRREEILIIHHLTGWATQCPGIYAPIMPDHIDPGQSRDRDIAVEGASRSL